MALTSTELPVINLEKSVREDRPMQNAKSNIASNALNKIEILKEEVEMLRREVAVMKKVLRNEIARYEISQVKHGNYTSSIVK